MAINRINLKTFSALIIDYLEATIADEMILNSFIRDLQVIDVTDNEVIIATASFAAKNLIEKEYLTIFNQAIEQIFEKPLSLRIIINGEEKYLTKTKPTKTKSEKISIKYKFKNYVIAKFNEEVVAIAKKIIQSPTKFSPFYINSQSGLGKTHLLHAIGNAFNQKNKSSIYIEPNSFTRSVVELSKQGGGALQNFIDKINSFDILLFDDIQNLGDKQVTLKILFNIINNAIENNKQIVITSDKIAQELSGFESRFITRFSSGISSMIKQPSMNDLIKILEFKLDKEGMSPKTWENEALRFIARNNSSSIRSIEGAVKRVMFFTESINNVKYTYTVISNIFKELSIDPSELTPNRVLQTVATYYKINQKDIISKSRKREFVTARHMSFWLIRKINTLSYAEIGKIIGGRDHSTVLSAINKIEHSMKLNNAVKVAALKIESKIKNVN